LVLNGPQLLSLATQQFLLQNSKYTTKIKIGKDLGKNLTLTTLESMALSL